jgi:hypothetical protein
MSLDIDLMVTQPVSVFDANITHNLGKMADQVKLSNGMTLYQVLWRPDEHGLRYARDMVDLLQEGWLAVLQDHDSLTQFNPDNGWGSVEALEKFLYNYRIACWDNPDAELRVSR